MLAIVVRTTISTTGRSHYMQFHFNVTWKFKPLFECMWKFQFNTIWHTRSMVALVLCWRLPESDITLTPSVMCTEWLHMWYNHTGDVVPPARVLAFVTKMSEKVGSTSPSAIHEEKLEVIGQLEKGERIVDIGHNVRFACSSVHTIHDNAETITGSVKYGTKVFV